MDEERTVIVDGSEEDRDLHEEALALEASLLSDLEQRGLTQPVFIRKAREYARFWETKERLDADVRDRGVMVWDEKRKMMVDNVTVSRSVQVANMMQAIFRDLGFKEQAVGTAKGASTKGKGEVDAEDLLD